MSEGRPNCRHNVAQTSKKLFFKQPVSCNVKLHLHKTVAFISGPKGQNAFIEFQGTNVMKLQLLETSFSGVLRCLRRIIE